MSGAKSLDLPGQLRAPTTHEFDELRALIRAESGIELSEAKRALLYARLAPRLRELKMTSFADYCERVSEDLEERAAMLDRIATNETAFFREPQQFEVLEQRIFPAWRAEADAGRRPRRVRAWSAACSTGEEPYSIAMTLLAHLPPQAGWSHEVVATDLSHRALHHAAQATWSFDRARQIPRRYLHAFMLRGVGAKESLVRAGPELRAIVRFSHAKLNEPVVPVAGTFDLVFCRNVLIYFGEPVRQRVVEQLLTRVAPGGLLLVGHAETLQQSSARVRAVAPNIYAPTSSRPSRAPKEVSRARPPH